jgi:hypothetical protein
VDQDAVRADIGERRDAALFGGLAALNDVSACVPSAALDETMTTQGKAFFGQYLLPLIAGADSVALVQEPLRFLGGSEPRELGAQRMLGCIRDWR